MIDDDYMLLKKLENSGIPVTSLGPVGPVKQGVRLSKDATPEQQAAAERMRKAFYSDAGKLERAKERATMMLVDSETPRILLELAKRIPAVSKKLGVIEAATTLEELKGIINGG